MLLGELLKRAGEPYSHATGEFLDKALAQRGRRARLEYLCRGLGWSVREIEAALPRVPEKAGVQALTRIRDTHRGSLASCNALLKTQDL